MSKGCWWTTKIKKNPSFILEKFNLKNINVVWNVKLQEKFWEALINTKESIVGDESKVEEVFNTIVFEEYSRVEFSLEETYRIFDLIEEGLNKCDEINSDLYYKIKELKYLFNVYDYCYQNLDKF